MSQIEKISFFKKNDIIIYAILLIIIILSIALIPDKVGNKVEIYYNNDLIAVYKLNIDKDLVAGGNTITIQNGKVFMSFANCEKKVCTHSQKIFKGGQKIVCLPNKILVIIKGEKELDGVTG